MDFVGACFDISEGVFETDIINSRGGLFDFMFNEFAVLKIEVYVDREVQQGLVLEFINGDNRDTRFVRDIIVLDLSVSIFSIG